MTKKTTKKKTPTKKKAASKKTSTKKKAASKKVGRKPISKYARFKSYDPKKHVKLPALAEELGVEYQSVFNKLETYDIKAPLVQDERKVRFRVITVKEANLIRSKTATEFISKDRIAVLELEKKYNVNRVVMQRIVSGLNIDSKKQKKRDGKRPMLTIPRKSIPAVVEEIKNSKRKAKQRKSA